MSQSLSQNYIHIIFSTKYRKANIPERILPSLISYLTAVCKNQKCDAHCIGGYRDHIHILCRLSKNITLSRLILEIKTSSSKWMKLQRGVPTDFFWQTGYAAFSISQSYVDHECEYIRNQHKHHASISFEDELKGLLNENEMAYDERYLWEEEEVEK